MIGMGAVPSASLSSTLAIPGLSLIKFYGTTYIAAADPLYQMLPSSYTTGNCKGKAPVFQPRISFQSI